MTRAAQIERLRGLVAAISKELEALAGEVAAKWTLTFEPLMAAKWAFVGGGDLTTRDSWKCARFRKP